MRNLFRAFCRLMDPPRSGHGYRPDDGAMPVNPPKGSALAACAVSPCLVMPGLRMGAGGPDPSGLLGIPIGVPSDYINNTLVAARRCHLPAQEMACLALALGIIAKERGHSRDDVVNLVCRAYDLDLPLVPLDAAG